MLKWIIGQPKSRIWVNVIILFCRWWKMSVWPEKSRPVKCMVVADGRFITIRISGVLPGRWTNRHAVCGLPATLGSVFICGNIICLPETKSFWQRSIRFWRAPANFIRIFWLQIRIPVTKLCHPPILRRIIRDCFRIPMIVVANRMRLFLVGWPWIIRWYTICFATPLRLLKYWTRIKDLLPIWKSWKNSCRRCM